MMFLMQLHDMTVRGAPLIGAAGAFGIYLATLEINSHTNIREHLSNAARYLISCRPTAVNLSWAVNYVLTQIGNEQSPASLTKTALMQQLRFVKRKKKTAGRLGNMD